LTDPFEFSDEQMTFHIETMQAFKSGLDGKELEGLRLALRYFMQHKTS